MEPATARIVIDLDVGSAPPTGRLEVAGSEDRFSGWLELLSALGSAIEQHNGSSNGAAAAAPQLVEPLAPDAGANLVSGDGER